MMSKDNADISLNESKISIDLLNDSFVVDEKEKIGSEKRRSSKHKPRQIDEKQQEEKNKKEIEKKKKDLEKELERKKKEEEKKLKMAEKDEEKKRKEEEKRLKDEEKRFKDAEKEEDRRKKEEEKKRREEEKRKEESLKKKPLTTILSFFQKTNKIVQDVIELGHDLQKVGVFKPIDLKKDMRLSAIERIKRPLIESLSELVDKEQTYLEDIVNRTTLGSNSDTWPIDTLDCDVIESSVPMRYKTKSFLFTENVRPPYFGTWRKISNVITPLNPLCEDTVFFDYDVDSDQEWEYESGEDISNSDGEVEEEVNDEGDDSSFVVPHDYLSDGENCSDVETDLIEIESTTINHKRSISPKSRQAMIEIREKQFQAEVKQKVQNINPNTIGPYLIDSGVNYCPQIQQIMECYRMICQTQEGTPINCNTQSDFDHSLSSTKIKSVPIDAISHLIRLLHHNPLSRAKICYEFRMYWEHHLTSKLPDVTFDDDVKGKDWDEFTIGKKRLVDKIKEISERKDGKWIVKADIIVEYQLCCVDDDPHKELVDQWKYVSDILKLESSRKVQRKSKMAVVDEQQQNNVTPKPTKRQKQSIDPLLDIKAKNVKRKTLNPTVQLIDNANEKLEEWEANRMLI